MTERTNATSPFVLSGALTSVLVGCVGLSSQPDDVKGVLLLIAPLAGSFIAFLVSVFLAYLGFHSTEDVKAHAKLDKGLEFVEGKIKKLELDPESNADEIKALKENRLRITLAKSALYVMPKDDGTSAPTENP
ncbi:MULTISPECIES: hypothetical protein [Shewanella]|uniref:hypothetical protein n=1 Tax=Shewanella TaxID=22 RepID=UPI000BB64C24|nr:MULTISPECIES: hypothetical protein [Shewanella]MBZ4680671.1 hypothetical protein [Shewanella sp.]PBQ28821.1 hypothetical protein AYI97_07260 [Shewanella algae]